MRVTKLFLFFFIFSVYPQELSLYENIVLTKTGAQLSIRDSYETWIRELGLSYSVTKRGESASGRWEIISYTGITLGTAFFNDGKQIITFVSIFSPDYKLTSGIGVESIFDDVKRVYGSNFKTYTLDGGKRYIQYGFPSGERLSILFYFGISERVESIFIGGLPTGPF